MTEVAGTAPQQAPAAPGFSLRGALAQAEIDTRLLGMLVALIVLLVGFQIVSGGTFLALRGR